MCSVCGVYTYLSIPERVLAASEAGRMDLCGCVVCSVCSVCIHIYMFMLARALAVLAGDCGYKCVCVLHMVCSVGGVCRHIF